MKNLLLRNRQQAATLRLPLLRAIATFLLEETRRLAHYDLAVHLVSAAAMARLNQEHLHHHGSTDVITFDYGNPVDDGRDVDGIAGEIFISVDDAAVQAREYKTHWTGEVVRYLVHGILHLEGHDDLAPAPRRAMKRVEHRCVRELARRFPLRNLGRLT